MCLCYYCFLGSQQQSVFNFNFVVFLNSRDTHCNQTVGPLSLSLSVIIFSPRGKLDRMWSKSIHDYFLKRHATG